MELTSQETGIVVWLLADLFERHRDSRIPTAVRQFAAKSALDIDGAVAAACAPALLRAIGPEAAALVKVQAAGMRGSEQDVGRAPLTCSEAARLCQVSDRAIRSACASRSLTATKDRISGAWRITRQHLAEWETRRAGWPG